MKHAQPKPPTVFVALRLLFEGKTITGSTVAGAANVGYNAGKDAVVAIKSELAAFVEHDPAPGLTHACRLRSKSAIPSTDAEQEHLLGALNIAQSLLGAFQGSALRGQVGKTIAGLVKQRGQHPDDLARRFRGRARAMTAGAAGTGVIDSVVVALISSKKFRCRYTTTKGLVHDLELAPLTLLMDDIGVHLYARCSDCQTDGRRVGTSMTYALPRVQDVVLGEHFNYPPLDEFDPTTEFGPAFGLNVPRHGEDRTVYSVVLRFTDSWESYLRGRALHSSQLPLKRVYVGGSNEIEVELRVWLTYDLVHWIRGHGKSVRVESPLRLKEWVESGAGQDFAQISGS